VILEIVQQASLRTLSRGELKRCNKRGNAEQFNTTWVCISSPVTMFPTARRAALITLFCSCLDKKDTKIFYRSIKHVNHQTILIFGAHVNCLIKIMTYIRRSTRRLQTPASITACILSFGPSLKYESAQQASASTSKSVWLRRFANTGKQGATLAKSGAGFFPRQRFDNAHTALRVIESRGSFESNL